MTIKIERPVMPILFLSGGKDSCGVAAALFLAGEQFLAYTYDNGFLSPQARKNIENVVRVTGCDHVTFFKRAAWYDSYVFDHKARKIDVCGMCTCFQSDYYAFGYALAHERGGVVITGSDGKDDGLYARYIQAAQEFATRNKLSLGTMQPPKVRKINYWVDHKQNLPEVLRGIEKLFSWESNIPGDTSTRCLLAM